MNETICPLCGGAIRLIPGAIQEQTGGAILQNPAQIPDAISAQNGQIAQMILGSKTATKDGRRAYNLGYPEEFEVFWKVYPMRKSKRKSLIAWRNAIRRIGANPADAILQILEGAKRYRDDPNRSDEFTKYAEGWLNGDRWEDDALPVRLGGKEPAPKTVTEDDYRRISHD